MYEKNILNEIIKYNEPITIEKFIEISLYSKNGYYKKSDVIGKKGDFITSPEISQLFGEILGLFINDFWSSSIKQNFNLIELGPGKGTLLLDILRVNNADDNFINNLNINLVEKNIKLIAEQKNLLKKNNINLNKIRWLDDFKINSKNPIIVLANEFFDCFPVRQFYKKKDKWNEKMVQFNNNEKYLQIKDRQIDDLKTLNLIKSYNPNDVLEISEAREKYFSKICKKIFSVGGSMIAIDYGYIKKPNNFTLQALFNNKKSNVLENIGYQDISSLVDFDKLIKITKNYGLKIYLFNSQHDFFVKYGIKERYHKLSYKCSGEQKKIIKNGIDRIIDKKNMGSLFKVLIITK